MLHSPWWRTRIQTFLWPPSDMKGAAASRRGQGWRTWIKITINKIKKNKYLAIIEDERFILHIHSAGWTVAPKKSICNYRHPTLGRSSHSLHLPPPALPCTNTITLKTNVRTALGPEQEEQEIKGFSLLSTAIVCCLYMQGFCVLEPFCIFVWILDLVQRRQSRLKNKIKIAIVGLDYEILHQKRHTLSK